MKLKKKTDADYSHNFEKFELIYYAIHCYCFYLAKVLQN